MQGPAFAGFFDANTTRAAKVASELGITAFPTLEALLDVVDAVTIVVPTPAHFEVAREVLSRGIHALIEKPIATTLEEADAMLALARVNGAIVQTGHVERFNRAIRAALPYVDAPRFIQSDRLAPFNPRGADVAVVLDLMIHDIGIVMALVKSPLRRIDSLGINVLSKTEDIANARLEFESGCVANLNASRISVKANREIRIFQENAYLSLDFMNQKGHLIKKSDIIAYGLKLKIGLAKPGDASAIPVHPIPIEKGEPLAIELAHFVDSVARAREPKVGGELGKSALEVAIRITEQIRSGKR